MDEGRRRARRRLGVSGKLTLGLVSGVLVVQALLAAIWLIREDSQLEREVARREQTLAHALSMAVAEKAASDGPEEAAALLERIAPTDGMRVRWVDEVADGHPVGEVVHRPGEEGTLAVWYSPVPGTASSFLEVATPVDAERSFVDASAAHAGAAMLITLALAGAVAFGLGRIIISRPVRSLVNHTRRVARGDLQARLDAGADDELGALSHELNEMTAALQQTTIALEEETQRRIEALESLRHVDRLRTVGTLASGLAHELGTPLHCVRGYGSMLLEDRALGPDGRERVGVMITAAERMTKIIDRLLTFARRESRDRARSDVAPEAQGTIALLRPLISERSVSVELDVEDGLPPVACAADELRQILTNLVVNAIHATPPGSDGITVEAVREGDVVAIRVVDHGPGIPPELSERVFDPFFTTKEPGEGTGLGLSVVFGIVRDRGGQVEVGDRPGGGTIMMVRLPASSYAEAEPAATDPLEVSGSETRAIHATPSGAT